jgi:hypothetical protein
VADVKHVNPLLFLHNTKDQAIDVRLVTVKEMAELGVVRHHRTAVWQLFQAENRLLEHASRILF